MLRGALSLLQFAVAWCCYTNDDCYVGTYCDTTGLCYDCSYIDADRCDAIEGSCCSASFLDNCPSNPAECEYTWIQATDDASCDDACTEMIGSFCVGTAFSTVLTFDDMERVASVAGFVCPEISQGNKAKRSNPEYDRSTRKCFYGGGSGTCDEPADPDNLRFCPCRTSPPNTSPPSTSPPSTSSPTPTGPVHPVWLYPVIAGVAVFVALLAIICCIRSSKAASSVDTMSAPLVDPAAGDTPSIQGSDRQPPLGQAAQKSAFCIFCGVPRNPAFPFCGSCGKSNAL